MDYRKAIEIAEMCRPDEFGAGYPPTNPAVLLEAARVIYLEIGGNSKPMRAIIAWLVHLLCIANTSDWVVDFDEPASWLEEE